jgi:hypothetical protein
LTHSSAFAKLPTLPESVPADGKGTKMMLDEETVQEIGKATGKTADLLS